MNSKLTIVMPSIHSVTQFSNLLIQNKVLVDAKFFLIHIIVQRVRTFIKFPLFRGFIDKNMFSPTETSITCF